MINTRERVKIRPYFRWFDLWIGVYVDRKHRAVYIGLVPTIGVKVWLEKEGCCHYCGEPAKKTAVNTGDGWVLQWECVNDDCLMWGDMLEPIEWPFPGADWASGRDFREIGFEVV